MVRLRLLGAACYSFQQVEIHNTLLLPSLVHAPASFCRKQSHSQATSCSVGIPCGVWMLLHLHQCDLPSPSWADAIMAHCPPPRTANRTANQLWLTVDIHGQLNIRPTVAAHSRPQQRHEEANCGLTETQATANHNDKTNCAPTAGRRHHN